MTGHLEKGAKSRTWRYTMKKFYVYRACAALASIAAIVVAAGAGWKWD